MFERVIVLDSFPSPFLCCELLFNIILHHPPYPSFGIRDCAVLLAELLFYLRQQEVKEGLVTIWWEVWEMKDTMNLKHFEGKLRNLPCDLNAKKIEVSMVNSNELEENPFFDEKRLDRGVSTVISTILRLIYLSSMVVFNPKSSLIILVLLRNSSTTRWQLNVWSYCHKALLLCFYMVLERSKVSSWEKIKSRLKEKFLPVDFLKLNCLNSTTFSKIPRVMGYTKAFLKAYCSKWYWWERITTCSKIYWWL